MVFDFERWGLTPTLRAAFSDAQSNDFSSEIINFNATVPVPFAPHGPQLARILGARRGPRFDLITAEGLGEGLPRGALYAGALGDAPVVGDWVRVRPLEPGRWVVEAVLPRFGVLARRGAGEAEHPQIMLAHVDHLWVVGGLDGDFNPRRIERMLLAARIGEIPATVLLNKADLCTDPAAFAARLQHPQVVAVSALTGQGLDALRAHRRPGETVALLGSSGVGKSSLLNALVGEARQSVGAVRTGDDRGRHTTVDRRLIAMHEGWLLADLPGVRSLSPWRATQADLDAAFEDVAPHLHACAFRDCAHDGEPGCAVRAALDAGTLDPKRYAAWQKLQKEQAFERRRDDPHAQRVAARAQKKRCRDAQARVRAKGDRPH